MSYIVSTSILGIQTFVTRFDPSVRSQKDPRSCPAPAVGADRSNERVTTK